MSAPFINFRYVETFLKNVGVKIRAEPGQYVVMRKDGPWHERQGFDDLQDAFVYGLQLALRPPVYRSHSAWRPRGDARKREHDLRAVQIRKLQADARRSEIASEKITAEDRRADMIRAELARLDAVP
jgi:hypothetical protein